MASTRKGHRKFKKKEVLEAIAKSGGVIEAVAKRLGAERTTIRKYIKEDPEYAQAMYEARESFKDLAENKLMAAVNSGNLTAIIFTLKTIAKDRGYIEKQEVHTTTDQPFVMTQEQADSVYHKRGS